MDATVCQSVGQSVVVVVITDKNVQNEDRSSYDVRCVLAASAPGIHHLRPKSTTTTMPSQPARTYAVRRIWQLYVRNEIKRDETG